MPTRCIITRDIKVLGIPGRQLWSPVRGWYTPDPDDPSTVCTFTDDEYAAELADKLRADLVYLDDEETPNA